MTTTDMESSQLAAPHAFSEVAVILPTYNCAPSLARAIDSALAQTYRDFRIYVIDDGSTDATEEVMRQYSDRCVYIRQLNSGAAAARNRGIRESSSTYLAFLDADDRWLPTKLELQIDKLKTRPDLGLLYSDFSLISAIKRTESFYERNPHPPDEQIFQGLLRGHVAVTPSIVIPRRVLNEVGLFNESLRISEDLNLWLKISSRYNVHVMPEVLVEVFGRPEGLSAMNIEMLTTYGILALEDVLATCQNLSPTDLKLLRRTIADRYYVRGSHQMLTARRESARSNFTMALRNDPLHWRAFAKLSANRLPASVFRASVSLYRRLAGRSATPAITP